jgi:hypothetical protein
MMKKTSFTCDALLVAGLAAADFVLAAGPCLWSRLDRGAG